jgi:hypothetical protein
MLAIVGCRDQAIIPCERRSLGETAQQKGNCLRWRCATAARAEDLDDRPDLALNRGSSTSTCRTASYDRAVAKDSQMSPPPAHTKLALAPFFPCFKWLQLGGGRLRRSVPGHQGSHPHPSRNCLPPLVWCREGVLWKWPATQTSSIGKRARPFRPRGLESAQSRKST